MEKQKPKYLWEPHSKFWNLKEEVLTQSKHR